MKLEQISLRTGFLLALAGWAAAVWLATGFGLGSQLPGADGDADAVPSLPVLPPLAAERMPSADSYSAIGERPLFAEDRRPKPYLLGGSEPAASAALRLTGVLLTGDFGMATFTTEQNRSLRLRLNGEAVDGWQLVGLAPRQATVIGPSGSQVLELAVFNGQGGEPPTVLRGANGAP
ncbi:general secretion pathway protein GspN, partial [Stenotrophomonas maltophilia]